MYFILPIHGGKARLALYRGNYNKVCLYLLALSASIEAAHLYYILINYQLFMMQWNVIQPKTIEHYGRLFTYGTYMTYLLGYKMAYE